MIFSNPAELKERIETLTGRKVRGRLPVTEDTSNYMSIAFGTVVRLEGSDYFVTADAKEGRFGIGDQPKLWVKYAVDLTDGSRKVLKLVFHEQFTTNLGSFKVRCRRSPDKESQVLEAFAGDPRFMQGRTAHDAVGNNVRVIDLIRGTSLFNHIALLEQSHEQYFHETLPPILTKVATCIDAIADLHAKGLQHGDVRNDHILIDAATREYRWIDFDYSVNYLDYDIWSLGNILTYAVGKGIRTCREAQRTLAASDPRDQTIGPDDALLFFGYRLANLQKLYPYVPSGLNSLLMRFSASTTEYYESAAEVARDVRDVIASHFR